MTAVPVNVVGLAPSWRGDSSPDGHVFRTVDYLLRPKSIALVGASDSSRGGWVQEIYDNLEFSGFPAKLYLVNPKRRELWGRPVYSRRSRSRSTSR